MVINPCLVVIKDAEAFTATAATVAIAVASICISVMLRNVNVKATAEITQTALRSFITVIYAVLALSTRAVAECKCMSWQWPTSDTNVAATTEFTIDTSMKERSQNKFIEYSRCR